MEQARIDRINELAKKARTQGLTPEEEAERAGLRREYLESVRASLKGQLDHTYVFDPDTGKEWKLRSK